MGKYHAFWKPALAAAMAGADSGEVVVEKDQPGQPHKGKVFAAVHAHLDDIPYYAAGLCAKLMREGYTGYLIRTSNDEKRGGGTTAQNILSNEQEHLKMAAVLGFKDVFDLYYQNHEMDGISSLDIRGRLILLFRFLKVNTVISFNPWGHGEENPDHWVTGRAVEEACWMCGVPNDFEEHREAGIPAAGGVGALLLSRTSRPAVQSRGGHHLAYRKEDRHDCRMQGPGRREPGITASGPSRPRTQAASALEDDDRAADRAYIRQFLLDDDREYGKPHNLAFAERFYYIDQRRPEKSKVDEYVEKNAVSY